MCVPNYTTIFMSQPGNRHRWGGRSGTDLITFLSSSAVKKTVDADSSTDVFFLFPAFLSFHLLTRSSGLLDANNKPKISVAVSQTQLWGYHRWDWTWPGGKKTSFSTGAGPSESRRRTRSLQAHATIKRWRKWTVLICSEHNQRLLGNSIQPESGKKLQVDKCPHSDQAFLNAPTALPTIPRQGHCWKAMAIGQEKWARLKKTVALILADKSHFCSNCGPLRDSVPQLICPWLGSHRGTGCCETQVNWPCCRWSDQTPGWRMRMLQRTDGVALLSRLYPSCTSPSNPGLTKVLSSH